jgi:hypothetical protein
VKGVFPAEEIVSVDLVKATYLEGVEPKEQVVSKTAPRNAIANDIW